MSTSIQLSTSEEFKGADDLRWILYALLSAIWDNADWLHFRRRSYWWDVQKHVEGDWHEMVPFPRRVPVFRAWGQLARSGLEVPRWGHWLRAAQESLLLLGQPAYSVALSLDGESVELGVPWETVLGGSAWHGEMVVEIRAGREARARAHAILDRWSPPLLG